MPNIEEITKDHGKIDLNFVLKPIIAHIRENPGKLLRESDGKVYVVTDEIIKGILDDPKFTEEISREGRLFSNLKYADAVATQHKSGVVSEKQMRQITEMEDLIYEHLRSKLKGKEADFFGQSASSYFNALNSVAGKKADIDSQQRSAFPDGLMLKEYPGGNALLRVPHHTIQMSARIPDSVVSEVKRIMKTRLSEESPEEDEIDDIIERVDKDLADHAGHLHNFLGVLDRDTYGRIRRTYACSIMQQMADQLPGGSPAIPYIQRVCDFNELVQRTLPESGLAADDLVLEFPNPHGRGVMPDFDLMTEFAYADALDALPFWVTFSELLSESTSEDRVTTTMGQHFKMNGNVPSKGADSVFEFNVAKLETLAEDIRIALAKGQQPPNEYAVRKVLRIVVLYYVVFRDSDDGKPPRDALTNYNEFKEAITKLTARKTSLDNILTRIADMLKKSASVNKKIQKDFKGLLTSRKLDKLPLNKTTLWLIVSRGILSKTADMENAMPIVPPTNHVASYLRYLKVTCHPGEDYQALIKEDIRFTESLRYLTLPKPDQRGRGMKRDIDRRVLGVLFTPRDNDMNYFSVPFKGLTKLVISYDRNQMHGINSQSGENDMSLAALARLIYVLLAWGVLKSVTRMDDDTKPHAEKTMMMFLSLFSTSLQKDKSAGGFTHDAHKAIEHIIRQHVPTKSQGFKLTGSAQWDKGARPINTKSKAACAYIKKEFKDYRFWNIATGLSSGMDALWDLPEAPGIQKIALISVTSRACDRLRKRSDGDRIVMFGDIQRFEHEMKDDCHFYRHKPVQAFCDDMDAQNCFKSPSVLFASVKKLYEEGFRDVAIVTKVPFTRRIRMTTYNDSTYINPVILRTLHKEMPDMRIYPLFTQKSYGVRLHQGKTAYPIFLPPDAENDEAIQEASDKSTLFRAGSVVTYRIVEGGKVTDRLHSGISDYLFRCYPETMAIQSEAMSVLTTPGKEQACLHEVLRFLHSNAYEKSLSKAGREKSLEAKLDALETIIGEISVGQQADILQFPKPKKGVGTEDKIYTFSVNIIALLKHLENQSDLYREKTEAYNHGKDNIRTPIRAASTRIVYKNKDYS